MRSATLLMKGQPHSGPPRPAPAQSQVRPGPQRRAPVRSLRSRCNARQAVPARSAMPGRPVRALAVKATVSAAAQRIATTRTSPAHRGPPRPALAYGMVPARAANPGAALLEGGELQRIVFRWREIQAHFVDEPRTAVERADALVADLMQQLAAMFARERTALEQQWADGDRASTEELRQNLRRYRSLFERLLNA